MNRKHVIYLFISLVVLTLLGYVFLGNDKKEYISVENNITDYKSLYVGSENCRDCHPQAFADWKMSDHFKAMQHATDSTVLGNFNDVNYTADGITSRFFKKDGKFYIHTEGKNGIYQDFEIVFTFGYYPLQQYITKFEGGKMQVFRQSWDSQKNQWFHQYAGQKIPHDDYLHWTNASQNWNLMCASCHSTNLEKNYDAFSDTYQTSYSELTVGCESCHGAGKQHIDFVKSANYQAEKSKELFIRLGKNTDQIAELNSCMPCHSRRGETSQFHSFSTEIMDEYIPEIPTKNIYYADGQAFDEVYKYGSFLQSKMFHYGIRCSNCHFPHSGKIRAVGNQLCLQCHTTDYGTSKHTFHPTNSEASDCRVCHMPTRTYMGNDVRHDHNFSVPRPDLSAKYDVPNACNDCHTDKTAKWAATAVQQWYGKERKPHFAEDLVRGSDQKTYSLQHLEALLNNSSTPNIIRATAVHYLSGIHTQQSFELIKKELYSADPQTRYRAVLALGNFPIQSYENELFPLLSDEVKSVRLATAYLVLAQKGGQWAKMHLPAFEPALQEYETFVLSQADFPLGSATAGDYFTLLGDNAKAILFYERAVSKDKSLNHIRLNLAMLYNGVGQNYQAARQLNDALTHEPNNPQIYYFLALLRSEQSDYQQAKTLFEKAMQLGMDNEAIHRNYEAVKIQLRNGSR